jgi:hypothetical protein
MDHLRRLSLFVDEPEPDHFYWLILESKHDVSVWAEHSSALHGETSWLAAWNAGTLAYIKLVKNKKIGPRTTGEDEDVAPVGLGTTPPSSTSRTCRTPAQSAYRVNFSCSPLTRHCDRALELAVILCSNLDFRRTHQIRVPDVLHD